MDMNKNDLFEAAARLYLLNLKDPDRSELTLNEAKELFKIIDKLAGKSSSAVPHGKLVTYIVQELKEKIFPAL